jgi:hypothetical protein
MGGNSAEKLATKTSTKKGKIARADNGAPEKKDRWGPGNNMNRKQTARSAHHRGFGNDHVLIMLVDAAPITFDAWPA